MASSSTSTTKAEVKRDLADFIPLHRAILRGDWEKAQEIFSKDKDALTAGLDSGGDTSLHAAIGTHENIQFLKNLLKEINPESLLTLVTNTRKHNPLHRAAIVGNTKAAELLVEKNPDLLFTADHQNYLPIHRAVFNSQEPTFEYLLSACKQHIGLSKQDHNPFEGRMGGALLANVISSGFLDAAYELVKECPHLASIKDGDASPLKSIAKKWDAYLSGARYNSYQKFVYAHVPTEDHDLGDRYMAHDIESQVTYNAKFVTKCKRSCIYYAIEMIYVKFWKVALLHVSHIKQLQKDKVKHRKAVMLLKFICEEVSKLNKSTDIYGHYASAYTQAMTNNTPEAIKVILEYFPRAIWTKTVKDVNLPQVAIINRCENIYNFFVHEVTHDVHLLKTTKDSNDNNLLHLAGQLAPTQKLNVVSGAALQMQRELQWFKEVEKFMRPKDREARNKKLETPIMMFRREHNDLRKDGEEWMKKTADSYTITAALIITIVFAAAITVPGGNNSDNGEPYNKSKPSFIIFAIFDAISLFTSTTSLLLFLSILTARYAEEDFLYKLPNRLILGLAMLFLSVTSMMVAFSATLYIMFGQGKAWILIPIATLTCLPIASFVTLQLPLLVDLYSSTYGHGLFVENSENRMKQE